jgi:hypothetical protein
LGVFFVLLFVGIMQTPLNTHPFILYSLWQRILSTSKAITLFSLVILLSSLALPAAAQNSDFYKDFVIINGTYYYTNLAVNGLNPFDGKYFGEFDRGTGSLTLGAEANTFSTNNDDVQPPQLFYRIYLEDATPPTNFTALNLGFVVAGADGGPNNKKWNNTSNKLNLVATTSTPGVYVLEVFFRTDRNYNSNNFAFDSRNGLNYKGYFKVNGTLPEWNGTTSNSWTEAKNWTPNTVPDANTDAIIRYVPNGRLPIISDGIASVRTLTVIGNPSIPGDATLVQTGGDLRVFGNFNNGGSNFQQTGGTFTLAGNNTQAFDGANFLRVNVDGGSDKYLRGRMDVRQTLRFQSGRIVTATDNPNDFSVDLGAGAVVIDESETSYVLGVLRSKDQVVSQNNVSSFGNIGVDLLPTTGNPGTTTATRITGPSDFAYSGIGTSKSIRRGFTFAPSNNGIFNFSLVFHYLNTELQGTPEDNLLLFRSLRGSGPFENLGKSTIDKSNKTLTRNNIGGALAATFTLGNSANPLPVTLVSFTANPTAQGGALLRWATATETNNKGFGIERQLTSSDSWQSVGYLASGNNTTGGTYEYTDKSLIKAAFSPQAYYRLRQEDQDGKVSYSPVAVVSRSAVAASSDLLLSPVPVTGSNISLTFAEAGQAGSEITITNTQGQRLFSQTTQASANAALSLPVERLAAGVYIVSVRVPGQAVRHARFVKL